MNPIYIATRGSALALAQANFIKAECRRRFPELSFELKVIKTTGDKLQSASLAQTAASLPRGLFTKELEEALLRGEADLAVHSLKDLPTVLPGGLKLGATTRRADPRDVLIYRAAEGISAEAASKQKRGFAPFTGLSGLPGRACIGTSSNRRMSQVQSLRPDLRIVPLRGNVGTRLSRLAAEPALDAIILAMAGLERLGFRIDPAGELTGREAPAGLCATILEIEEMVPCVGQAAIGIEIRDDDARLAGICAELNHADTWTSVLAERAFLQATGGGCQSAVGAYAEICGNEVRLRAVSFLSGEMRRAEQRRPIGEAVELGEQLAMELTSSSVLPA